jgi:hypothetical protein
MTNDKGERLRLRLRLRGWRREEKCQVTNNAKWTRTTDTDTKHEHESQCQSSKLGIPGKPEKRTLSEREFGQQTVKHRSKGTREYPGNFRKNGIGECFSTERENLTKNYQPGFSYH